MAYPADYPTQVERGPHDPLLLSSEPGQWLTRNVRATLDVMAKLNDVDPMFEAELLTWMVLSFTGEALPHDEGELASRLGLWQEARIAGRNGPAALRVVGSWTPLQERAYDVTYGDSFEREDRPTRSAQQRRYREERTARLKKDPTLAPHGTASTYGNWGCRCPACCAAQSVKNQEGRARRRASRQPA